MENITKQVLNLLKNSKNKEKLRNKAHLRWGYKPKP